MQVCTCVYTWDACAYFQMTINLSKSLVTLYNIIWWLAQEGRDCSTLVMELRLFSFNPSIWCFLFSTGYNGLRPRWWVDYLRLVFFSRRYLFQHPTFKMPNVTACNAPVDPIAVRREFLLLYSFNYDLYFHLSRSSYLMQRGRLFGGSKAGGCDEVCHFDNFQCGRWRGCRRSDDLSSSKMEHIFN